MPKIRYETARLRRLGVLMINNVNKIVAEYRDMGYTLTLRQVYYQLVARDIIPNNDKSYTNLGEIINRGRMQGLVDWHAIEDRTRYVRALAHWDEPASIIRSAEKSYRIDLWEDQPNYVEVWVEKDALIGIVEQVARRHDVPCFSCRGYTSQTAMWDAAQRLLDKSRNGDRPVRIIHLGDHDPSGIDMTRDIEDRINMFLSGGSEAIGPEIDFKINRIALNMPQIKKYNPPPNPAKMTDSRFKSYVEQFGDTCWELDAIKPDVLDKLICDSISKHVDEKLMAQAKQRMEDGRRQLKDAEHFVENPDEWARLTGYKYFFGGMA